MSSPAITSTSTAMLTNVLVVGQGTVGQMVFQALSRPHYASQVKVSALIRPSTFHSTEPAKLAQLSATRKLGVTVLPGELSAGTVESLTNTLRSNSIHTVISTLGSLQIKEQLFLIAAAVAAGVKHFIPSEFGFDVEKIPAGPRGAMFDAKVQVRKAVVASGLNYTFIMNGPFTEFLLRPLLGINIETRTVTAASFDQKITTTAQEDVGNFIAHIITHPNLALNQAIYLAGSTITFEQIARALEKVTGESVSRVVRSLEEFKSDLSGHPDNVVARFCVIVGAQAGVYWDAEKSWNAIHLPNYKTKTVEEILRKKIETTNSTVENTPKVNH